MKNPFIRSNEVNSANPFGGWPNAGVIKGTQPIRSQDVLVPNQMNDNPDNNGIPKNENYHPLVFCLGSIAEKAGRFAIEQLYETASKSGLSAQAVFFGGSNDQLLTKKNWERKFSPKDPIYSAKEYQNWFASKVVEIIDSLRELMDSSTHIYVLAHLSEAEHGLLTGLLYCLRLFLSRKAVQIVVIVSPVSKPDDDFSYQSSTEDLENPLVSIREISRLTYKGYFRQPQFTASLPKNADDLRLADREYWIKSQDGDAQSDSEEMGEFLSLLLIPAVSLKIVQQRTEDATTFEERFRNTGVTLMDEVRCASLYLPITEHKKFLSAKMAEQLLTQEGGVFSSSINSGDGQDLLNAFAEYAEFQHPLFTWLIRDYGFSQALFPQLMSSDFDAYLDGFQKHLLAFINSQFLAGVHIAKMQSFVELLLARLQQEKVAFLQNNQPFLSNLLSEYEKLVNSIYFTIKSWTEKIEDRQEPQEESFSFFSQTQKVKSTSIRSLIEQNAQNSLEVLRGLTKQRYSIPAIDGDIANDDTVLNRIQDEINKHHLRSYIGWWLVQDQKQFQLRLFLQDRSFTSTETASAFWEALDNVLMVPIGDLISIDQAQFEFSLQKNVQKFEIVHTPGINISNLTTIKDLRMVCSYPGNLARDYSPSIFITNIEEIHTLNLLPYTKLSAVEIDQCLPLDQMPIFKNSLKGYFSSNGNPHLETGEGFAREIERDFYGSFDIQRLFSPDSVFCLQDPERVQLFFRLFLSGLIHPNIQVTQQHWVIDKLDAFGGMELNVSDEKEPILQPITDAFYQFTIGLLPEKIAVQNIQNPFHNFRWNQYRSALVKCIDQKLTTASKIAAVTPIFASYSVPCTESKLKNKPKECFQALFNELESQQLFKEFDIARLIYYYMSN